MKRFHPSGDAGKPVADADDAPSPAAPRTEPPTGAGDGGDERRGKLGVKVPVAPGDPSRSTIPPKKAGLRTRFLPSTERRVHGKAPRPQFMVLKPVDRDPRPSRQSPADGNIERGSRPVREDQPRQKFRPPGESASRRSAPAEAPRSPRDPQRTGPKVKPGGRPFGKKTPTEIPPRRTAPASAGGRVPDARRPDAARRPPAAVQPAADPAKPTEGVRLSKVMAERGLCSRREADAIIERGWVFVDGQRVSELGTRIDPNAEITLAAQAKRQQMEQVTILLHKPVGYVSGQPEPGFEPAVALIGPDNQFDRKDAQRFHLSHLKGLAPAGRLDIDSTGLLVLTQDGRIARQLIGDESRVDKEYLVRVEGSLDDEGLARLNHGLELDGRRLRPAKVEWLNQDQLRFVLREGRKRQIRRMCELVGLKVVGLKRVRIGGVRLGDLPLGQWRFLREDERF
jgi:23S rRNA pseudouridine2604 synthase